MLIITNTFDLGAGFLDEYFRLDKKHVPHTAGVVIVDKNTMTLENVFPSMGHTIVVGQDKHMESFLDGTTLAYKQSKYSVSGLGAYIEVDEDNVLIEYHVAPGNLLLELSFDPIEGTPQNIEDEISGVHFGPGIEGYDPLMDMLEEFGEMVKESSND